MGPSDGDGGDDDTALVRRSLDGDALAFEALVRAHQAAAIRLALLIAGSAADAEDIAQVAFVKAHRSLHRFRGGASFRTWILAIVANESRNHRRRIGRRSRYELALADDRAMRGGGALDPSMVAETRARSDALAAAMARLPSRQREVVACRYLLELSVDETAAVLELRPGTVKSHLSRALERLATEVASDG